MLGLQQLSDYDPFNPDGVDLSGCVDGNEYLESWVFAGKPDVEMIRNGKVSNVFDVDACHCRNGMLYRMFGKDANHASVPVLAVWPIHNESTHSWELFFRIVRS